DGLFKQYRPMPHAQLNELLKTCTAFVLISCEEGLARVIPEAMATSLPIIATYQSGATTLVSDGIDGFIVSHQRDQIVQAMIKLARDPDLCLRMGRAALARGAPANHWQDYGD